MSSPLLWVTPSLAIAVDWPEDDVLTADQATTWIQERRTPLWAIVADEATAAQVLHNLGLSEAEIADRLHFAKTGQVSSAT